MARTASLRLRDRAARREIDQSSPMQHALLLYNPLSGGRRRARRQADVDAVLGVLREAGVRVEGRPTDGPARAAAQAREAVSAGCDAVFACGGDGTVNDVLQGLVGSQTALGVIPLGTANSLAHDLCIPMDPARAARAAFQAESRRIAVGRVEYQCGDQRATRYFTVTVGVGVDAHLFYQLDPGFKGRLGMAAYYAKATSLWLTHKMGFFQARVVESDSAAPVEAEVSELLAVRISQFGGLLRELAPGASLWRNDLRLVLFRTRSRIRYLRYIVRGLLGRTGCIPGIELQYASRVRCEYLPGASRERIFVETDGELAGTLPAEISMVPDALTILVPRT
jgi:YegS/Rv2252/BmrU family lipid kinase